MHSQLYLNYLAIRYVQSWIDGREVRSERANLMILFDRYIPTCLETLRSRFKKITPITDTSMIQTLCYLLEALLTPENTPPDTAKEVYELYFVFAAVWAFGGSMFQDQVTIILLCYIIIHTTVIFNINVNVYGYNHMYIWVPYTLHVYNIKNSRLNSLTSSTKVECVAAVPHVL